MTTLRRVWAIGVLAWTAVSACEDSKATSLVVCQQFASAQEFCDTHFCETTWTAVETNQAYCDSCGLGTHLAGDCGDYRVLAHMGVDSGSSYYYRRDTGALVAAQYWSPPSPTGACFVVSTEVFAPPASCDTRTYAPLPGWCAADAGTDSSCAAGGASP